MANVTRFVPSLLPSMMEPDGFNAVLRRYFGERMADQMVAPLGWIPPCEITESPDALVLVAELPGVAPEAVQVSLEGETLTLRGERVVPKPEPEARVHLYERHHGTFVRSFMLPRSVDATRAKAEWKNGVLTVMMPKTAATKGRVIDIAIQK
jgi:HSP20 family protein